MGLAPVARTTIQSVVTHQLWGKYMRPWQPSSGNRAIRMTNEEEKKVLAELRTLMDAIDDPSKQQ